MSTLIAGLRGVNAAEDDEIGCGDGITDEWLSSRGGTRVQHWRQTW